MFNRKTCSVAANIASSLRSRHTGVVPNSREMGVLIEQVTYPIVHNKVVWGPDNVNDLIKTMSLHDMSNAEVAGEQQDTLNEYTAAIANTLKTNINITRRVAIPLIERTFGTIQERLNDFRFNHHRALMFDIRECREYELVNNVMFTDMVTKYNSSNFPNAVNSARVCGQLSHEELRLLIKTGSEDLDETVLKVMFDTVEIAGHSSMTSLERIWNRHFVRVEESRQLVSVDTVSSLEVAEFEEWVTVFLLASGLLNNELPEGIDVSRDDLQTIMNQYRAFSGYHVQRLVKTYVAKRSAGVLVVDEHKSKEGITVLSVVPDIYKQACDAGVTSEVMVGYKLIGGQGWFLDKIIKSKDEAAEAFRTMLSKRAVELQLAGRKIIKDTILENVRSMGRGAVPVSDDGTRATVVASNEQVNNASNLSIRDVEDVFDAASVFKVVQYAVAHGVFGGTMVPLIVDRMELLSDATDDIRSVGLFAAISLCVESLLSQFTVELNVEK